MTATTTAIEKFVGEYAFLANFHRCHDSGVTVEGITYPTAEHAYQAQKTQDPALREQIRSQTTPNRAKKLGEALTPDEGFDAEAAMTEVLGAKFADPVLKQKLLLTGSAQLVNVNHWGDTYWGVDSQAREGENFLGLILEQVRAEVASV